MNQKEVQRIFDYHEDGYLIHKLPTKRARKQGARVGYLNGRYIKTKVGGKPWQLHRLIFLYHHGYIPQIVDHIDGDPLNNRIDNLRECTISQNCMNHKLRVDSSSGHTGVTWDSQTNKWKAYISFDKQRKDLGYYISKADAIAARKEAESLFHGEFKRV